VVPTNIWRRGAGVGTGTGTSHGDGTEAREVALYLRVIRVGRI
jgi:hypothetical protein